MTTVSRARALGLALACGAAVCLLAPRAHATDDLDFTGCVAKPTRANTNAAKKEYEAGKALSDEGAPGAVEHFRKAYLLDCTKHELLVAIGFAYQSEGKLKEALAANELYRDKRATSLAASELKTLDARIDDLRAKIKEQDDETQRLAEEAARKKAPLPPPPTQKERERSMLPWAVVGVGAAGIVAGAIMLPVGAGMFPDGCVDGTSGPTCQPVCTSGGLFSDGVCTDFNNGPDSRAKAEQNQAAARTAKGVQRAGFVGLVAGGALVVTGVIWWLVDPGHEVVRGDRGIRWAPVVGPREVGVAGVF